jgi:hypothetical protein
VRAQVSEHISDLDDDNDDNDNDNVDLLDEPVAMICQMSQAKS